MMVFEIFDVAGITFQLSRLPNVVLPTAASTVIFGAAKVSRHHKSLSSIPPPTMGHLHQMSAVKYMHVCNCNV